MIEILENRLLLSASVKDGVLLVRGTKGGDTIEVRSTSDLTGRTVMVTDNGEVTVWSSQNHHFGPRGPRKIVIRGYDGNDDIVFTTTRFAGIRPVEIYAGSGGDVVTLGGARQKSRVLGGPGDDIITAHPGNGDTLDGGPGDDLLQTYTSNLDRDDPHYVPRLAEPSGFEGNKGSLLIGAEGDDTLVGSIFDDRLVGGPGMDALFGDEGKDTLKGGTGSDCSASNVDDPCIAK